MTIKRFDQTPIGRNLESYYLHYKHISESLSEIQSKEFFDSQVNVQANSIFYAANSVYFRSNLISPKAYQQWKDDITLDKLCKQHRYPRKLATEHILRNICYWTLDEFRDEIKRLSVYDMTTKEENVDLVPFQKSGIFDMSKPFEPYDKLKIKMVECPELKGEREDDQVTIVEETPITVYQFFN